MTPIERKARELLAAEYERGNWPNEARHIRENRLEAVEQFALRAIATALRMGGERVSTLAPDPVDDSDIPMMFEPAPHDEAEAKPEAAGEVTDEQVIARCRAAGIGWIEPDEDADEGGFPGSFDMATMADMRRLLAAHPAAVVDEGTVRQVSADIIGGMVALLKGVAVLGLECNHNGRPARDIIGDLIAAETADEFVAALHAGQEVGRATS